MIFSCQVDNVQNFRVQIKTRDMAMKYLQLYVPDLSTSLIQKFKSQLRSLEVYINNQTSEALVFLESYFFTGGMFASNDKPRDIQPHSGCVYFLANKSIVAGVSGGFKFKVVGKDVYMYLGFSNPLMGSYKTFVYLMKDGYQSAEQAYDMAENDSLKMVVCDEYIAEVALTYPYYSPFSRIHCKISYMEKTIV
ncbi:hypothetical protein ACJMK2_010949 [Sinanodonta woodiana]|uniref:Uncharacterized protein n=1 Tax=Sinanodonta woodiana TaxID=1069815 RepID=A0ABD3V4N4_SINWO